ncbi:MAG: CAAX prenyl protease-related protein [Verrucomicrobia bacterium]|nr:CAAX prenyl protease-related protein [Verrucomicrobiota bacterium]
MISRVTGSSALVRAVPFVVFVGLTFFQDKFGDAGRYWFYLAKTLAGAGMIWAMRPFIEEMRWKFSWEAVAVGVGVFAMWVGIDSFYPKLDVLITKLGLGKAAAAQASWNPHEHFGQGATLAWFFIAVRIVGSSLVVPPLEEVFFRSLLYRYIVKQDFMAVPLSFFAWMPFLVASALFGLEHREWLAGILCGFAYQGLVCLKGRLGDAIVAHAITNLLLGVWVAWRGAWHFW